MSNLDDREVEQYNRENEKLENEKQLKIQEIKLQIKSDLHKFRETNRTISSTCDERDEAIELAYNIIVEDIILENVIERIYKSSMEAAQLKKRDDLNAAQPINIEINKTKFPDFFLNGLNEYGIYSSESKELGIDVLTQKVSHDLEIYLRQINKPSTYDDEKTIIELAVKLIKNKTVLPHKIEENYNDAIDDATKIRTESLSKLEKYKTRIDKTKFKLFLEKIDSRNYKYKFNIK